MLVEIDLFGYEAVSFLFLLLRDEETAIITAKSVSIKYVSVFFFFFFFYSEQSTKHVSSLKSNASSFSQIHRDIARNNNNNNINNNINNNLIKATLS